MKVLRIVIALFPLLIFSNIIEVNIDGSEEFTSISSAMESANQGDTLLIYPGTYFENVTLDKDIALMSLFGTTGNEIYIDSTIVDGGNNSSVIAKEKFNYDSIEVVITGLTIQNGFARSALDDYYGGGGINAICMDLTVSNCKIINNRAFSGGGIFLGNCTAYLSDNQITGNVALWHSGGITVMNGECCLDEDHLNSVYNNYGGSANDIYYLNEEGNSIEIHLSTFTVADYDPYFIKGYSEPDIEDPEMINLIVDNYLIDPIAADFYVSPYGSNDNSGLSIYEPLQTVSYALAKYSGDSQEIHTIHIADGCYGISTNNEKLPWHLHSNLILQGESEENTVVSTEGYPSHIECFEYLNNITIRNLTLTSGNLNPNIWIYYADNLLLENITISDVSWMGNVCKIIRGNTVIKNLKIFDTFTVCPIALSNFSDQHFLLENIDVSGVYQFEDELYPCDNTCGIATMSDTPLEYARYDLVNCKFVDIYTYEPSWPTRGGNACSFTLFSDVNMVNCLVSNTRVGNDRDPAVYLMDSRLNLVNSIVYDVDNYPVYMEFCDMMLPELNVDHSLIQDGEDGILHGFGTFNWFEGNLDCDPLFNMAEPDRYSLDENSPCIDAGTLNLPEGITLPETDLAGNPRISGTMIDMGPYEWQYTNSTNNSLIPTGKHEIFVYPNPINSNTLRSGAAKVNWSGDYIANDSSIEIYNIKGQKVKSINSVTEVKNNKWQANWDVTTQNGLPAAAGVYFIRLKISGQYVAQKKVIVVK